MRVPGKSCEIVFGYVVAEIIQQKERIKVLGVSEAESTAKMHAGALHGWLGFDNAFHRSNRHRQNSNQFYFSGASFIDHLFPYSLGSKDELHCFPDGAMSCRGLRGVVRYRFHLRHGIADRDRE